MTSRRIVPNAPMELAVMATGEEVVTYRDPQRMGGGTSRSTVRGMLRPPFRSSCCPAAVVYTSEPVEVNQSTGIGSTTIYVMSPTNITSWAIRTDPANPPAGGAPNVSLFSVGTVAAGKLQSIGVSFSGTGGGLSDGDEFLLYLVDSCGCYHLAAEIQVIST